MGVTSDTKQDMGDLQKKSQGVMIRCHDDIFWVGKPEILLHSACD